jgi:hypothetical protein
MQAPNVTKLWQAVSPASATVLRRNGGYFLCPSAPGNPFALFKLSCRQAQHSGQTVWAPRFGSATVVEVVLYSWALLPYPIESVAYEDHQEYRIPTPHLRWLSLAQIKPARVLESPHRERQAAHPRMA